MSLPKRYRASESSLVPLLFPPPLTGLAEDPAQTGKGRAGLAGRFNKKSFTKVFSLDCKIPSGYIQTNDWLKI